ncbi:MAG TPA: zinc ribbon domain-containing protein [Tepidisphaeraceae bacterium]|nr:zinc ribbon domain-containing protein [Tepidisphaeraceae bacterium]
MPIYEYNCKKCENRFEKLVRTMGAPEDAECPKCGSTETARAISVFAVSSEAAGRSGGLPPGMCGRCGGPGPCAMPE